MPIFTLFMSLIVAAITGIILQSIFAQDNFTPEWIDQVVYSILALGLLASLPVKSTLCKLCSLIHISKSQLCPCSA